MFDPGTSPCFPNAIHPVNPSPLHERLYQAKAKHKQIALEVHRRARRQVRQKIAWAIIHRPAETLEAARQTLHTQILRCGKLPRYQAWERILGAEPKMIAKQLLREDARVEQRNACHPFGNALTLYEAHHLRRPH
jgi:hypothetical protein